MELQVLNCVYDGMNEATWFTEENQFTLNYVWIDGRGLRKVVGACVLDRGEVLESDHAAIIVDVEWNCMMRPCKKKRKRKRKKEYKQTEVGRDWQTDVEIDWQTYEWEGV